MKIWNWLKNNNGTVIKRTAIAAGSIIGLALLSGLTFNDGEEDEACFEEVPKTDGEVVLEGNEITVESTTEE